MSESFVDLTYRGLPLGRRIKLTQIRPSTGYLELPAPMPVGTAIAIATDEGVGIDAIVMQVCEQIGGADRPPGMLVGPALADAAAAAWWQARVQLPEAEPAARSVTVLPRARTPSTAPPVAAAAAAAATSDGVAGAGSDPPLVDDGKKTAMMASVELSALGLEAGASGQLAASDVQAAAAEGGDAEAAGGDDGEAGGGDPHQPVVPAAQPQAAGKKRKKPR